MEPFTILCTTCQSRLRIRDEAAIGQIHACPKCGSMVQVTVPRSADTAHVGEPAVSMALQDDKAPAVAQANLPFDTTPSFAEIAAQVSQATAIPHSQSTPSHEVGPWWSDTRFAALCLTFAAILLLYSLWPMTPASDIVSTGTPALVAESKETEHPSALITPLDTHKSSSNPPLSRAVEAASVPSANPASAANSPQPSSIDATKHTPDATRDPAGQPQRNLIKSAPEKPSATSANDPHRMPGPSVDPTKVAPSSKLSATENRPAKIELPESTVEPAVPPSVELPRPMLAQRLAEPIERIEFTDVPLYDWLRFVSRATNLPLGIDAEQLLDHGIQLDRRITVKKYNLSVQELLSGVLGEQGLDLATEDYQMRVIVAGPSPTELVEQRYSVEPLAPATPEQIGDLVRVLIEPSSWVDGDGLGTMRVEGGQLVVKQTTSVHRELIRLLTALRQLRAKQPSETPHYRRADAKLATVVQVNYPGPTPLATIVDFLRKQYGLILVIDHTALAAEQKTAQLAASLVSHEQPLSTALTTLLEPLGLVMRVVSANVIEITTPAGAELRPDLEFYSLAPRVAQGESSEAVLRAIVEQLPAVRWRETGGRGTLAFDATTGYLIVRHSQSVQRQIAELLAR